MLFFCFWPLHYIIIHWTDYVFSDWPKAYSEFSKWAPGTSSSCRLYNNHVKDTQGQGNHVMYDRGAWFVRVIMSSSRALCCLPSVKKQVCFVEARKKEIVQCVIKQLLDVIFVISRIIKVSVRIISRSRTPTSTLFILDITKISYSNCF